MLKEEYIKYKEETKYFEFSIIKRIEVAIVLEELPKMIAGLKEYEWSFYELKHMPVKSRVDYGMMLDKGFYILYNDGNKELPQLILDALYKLFEGNAIEVSAAYSFLWSQYWREIKGGACFKIITVELLKALEDAVKKNEKALKKYKDYEAIGCENGMWEDMCISSKSFESACGTKFITLE